MQYNSPPLDLLPQKDGVLFTDYPQRLVQKGKEANISIVTCNCDDEGTLFSLAQTNLSTDDQFKEWVQTFFLPTASEEGSPFDTGSDNATTPQFKRSSSFLGNTIFQGPRRFFI